MFQARKFLVDFFQSPGGIVALLSAYGLEPPKAAAAEKWFQREAIPSEWLPKLLVCLELENGTPTRLVSYLELSQ